MISRCEEIRSVQYKKFVQRMNVGHKACFGVLIDIVQQLARDPSVLSPSPAAEAVDYAYTERRRAQQF